MGDASAMHVLAGIRTSHTDFEGRAKPGWSAECETNTESGCGGLWAYKARWEPNTLSVHASALAQRHIDVLLTCDKKSGDRQLANTAYTITSLSLKKLLIAR